nr:hypothetical protein [Novosphingobium panipatense]
MMLDVCGNPRSQCNVVARLRAAIIAASLSWALREELICIDFTLAPDPEAPFPAPPNLSDNAGMSPAYLDEGTPRRWLVGLQHQAPRRDITDDDV